MSALTLLVLASSLSLFCLRQMSWRIQLPNYIKTVIVKVDEHFRLLFVSNVFVDFLSPRDQVFLSDLILEQNHSLQRRLKYSMYQLCFAKRYLIATENVLFWKFSIDINLTLENVKSRIC